MWLELQLHSASGFREVQGRTCQVRMDPELCRGCLVGNSHKPLLPQHHHHPRRKVTRRPGPEVRRNGAQIQTQSRQRPDFRLCPFVTCVAPPVSGICEYACVLVHTHTHHIQTGVHTHACLQIHRCTQAMHVLSQNQTCMRAYIIPTLTLTCTHRHVHTYATTLSLSHTHSHNYTCTAR